ncbi:OLC1v1024851C1 [Oldenlandia corymbosa var. corymbosa]|uniref:OLC1v1024851C1 n=1 Tax=Oldenlandia corymbosa var. corymbosa TaxID=529605 RepID=A0AAV1C5Q8_OLDCO|nr:OLC1v1024851C1 [Oldenlandia corymbosa var. corymbosa]
MGKPLQQNKGRDSIEAHVVKKKEIKIAPARPKWNFKVGTDKTDKQALDVEIISTDPLIAKEKETIIVDLQPSPERNENEIDVVNVHNSIPAPTTNRFSELQDMCDGEVDLTVETEDEVENVYTEGNDVQGDKLAALMNESALETITVVDDKFATPSNDSITDVVLASVLQSVVGKFPDDSFEMDNQDDNEDQEGGGQWSEREKDDALVTENEQGERTVKKKRGQKTKEARAKQLEGAELQRSRFSILKLVMFLFKKTFLLSSLYAKSNKVDRRPLWSSLETFRDAFPNSPWVVHGDFNVIHSLEEYSGSSVQDYGGIDEFNQIIESTGLFDTTPIGDEFTWGETRSTGWVDKRLDRILFTNEWLDMFPRVLVEHLSRTTSDHCPLLLQFDAQIETICPPVSIFKQMEKRYQRFLWQGSNEEKRKDWRSWDRLTFPTSENGLGLRRFQDVYRPFRVNYGGRAILEIEKGVRNVLSVHDLKAGNVEERNFVEQAFGFKLKRIKKCHCITVKWMAARAEGYRLNTDSSLVNTDSGYGFAIRKHDGNLICMAKMVILEARIALERKCLACCLGSENVSS